MDDTLRIDCIAVQGVILADRRVSSRGPPALTFTLPYPQYDRRPGRPHPVEMVHSKPSSADMTCFGLAVVEALIREVDLDAPFQACT